MKTTSLSYKKIFIIYIIILCVLLLPMLIAGMYAVPCADDYSYGYEAHNVFVETGSVLEALLRGLKHVGEVYAIWQGTYSAVFLFSIQPAVFGEQLYALTGVIMLSMLTAGCIAVCVSLFSGVFGLDKRFSACIGCVCAIACTQLLPSPVQGFYWYNGAIFYTFFYGLSLIAFAFGIKCITEESRASQIWLCVLCAILGGGNYVTALNCAIIAVSAMILLAIKWDERRKELTVPVIVLLIGFGISIAAPGNSIRQSTVENSPGVFEAILTSFAQCGRYSLRWFSPAFLAILVLIAPLLWHGAKNSSFAFRFPLLVTLYSYCVLSAMFCPPIYALGNVGEFRLLNIIFFAFVLLVIINIFYWLGWAAKKFKKTGSDKKVIILLPLAACAALSLAIVGVSIACGGSFTSAGAIGILRNGEAKAFHDCALERLSILRDPDVHDAELEDYPSHPYLLYYDDITADPSDWKNVDMASFYGKDSVILK
jgi:hypothetical protein